MTSVPSTRRAGPRAVLAGLTALATVAVCGTPANAHRPIRPAGDARSPADEPAPEDSGGVKTFAGQLSQARMAP
ncbi:hypothetical protein [Actinoplanes sp. NPDC049681]|uniref:hypothetical protein n=1 Tax=Actinoplanes sp. NPDC049681 TaxID=3363905 RepID=UPI0037887D26